jgi:hypothetical protein
MHMISLTSTYDAPCFVAESMDYSMISDVGYRFVGGGLFNLNCVLSELKIAPICSILTRTYSNVGQLEGHNIQRPVSLPL